MRDTATRDEHTPAHEVGPVPAGRPRGRHRKPRPRRTLFAVGGLALAAGALCLLRLDPEPPAGDVTATDIEPTDIEPTAAGSTKTPEPVSDTEAGVVKGTTTPRTSPSATTRVGGGDGPRRAPDPTVTPTAPTPPRTATPHRPTATPTPAKPPAPTPPKPAPTFRPPTLSPHPGHSDLCLPIVSLCLDTPRSPR